MTHSTPVAITWRRGTAALATAALTLAVAAQTATAAPAPATPMVLLANDEAAEVEVAAGGGHVVATRPTAAGSDLLALEAGAEPRIIRSFGGRLGRPTVGTDAKGRWVVVVSPCAKEDTRLVERTVGSCALQVVDIETGRSTPLTGSAGAYLGDLDRGRSVVARRSTSVGVRVTLAPTKTGGRSTSLPVAHVYPRLTTKQVKEAQGYPLRMLFVDALDLRGGSVAATVFVGMSNGGDGGASFLLRSDAGRRWAVLDRSSYGGASGIRRVFRAPEMTRTGVRAFFDGGDNEPSYVGRWTRAGDPTKSVPVRPSIVQDAAFDGDRLVTSSVPFFGCGTTDQPIGCSVDAWEPSPLG